MSISKPHAEGLLVAFAGEVACADSLEVAMRDRTLLHTEVYLPARARAGLRVPTVLIRAPYGVREDFMLLPDIGRYLTDLGMAVVVQDVRGKFRSEGLRLPFLHEVLDGYDTLSWLVDQPWSNGAVGMYGESYYGFTQWAAAASGHPALVAIAPVVTGSELPVWHARPGTVPFLSAPVGWIAGCWDAASMFARDDVEVLDFGRTPVLDIVADFPHAADVVSALVSPPSDLLALTYPGGRPAPRLSIPAFHRGGWWDNIKGSQLDDWSRVQTAPAAGRQRLEMAAMDHYSEPYRSDAGSGPRANDELPRDLVVERLVGSAAAFLQQSLGLRAPEPEHRVRIEVAGAGWVELDEWPPPSTRLTLHLCDGSAATASADGGSMRHVADTEGSRARIHYDPNNLVPSLAANEFHVLPDLPDEQDVHRRSDVATFTSEPILAVTDVVGVVEADLHVQASCPVVPLIVGLHSVTSDGRATLITEGSASAFLGGGEQSVRVVLGATGFRLQPGIRVRVSVSLSRFPRYLPPSGSLRSPWLAEQRRPFEVELITGASSRSRLHLPVLPAESSSGPR